MKMTNSTKKNQEKKTNSIVNWPSLIFKIIMKNIR